MAPDAIDNQVSRIQKRKKDSGSENLPPVEKKGLNRITSLA